MLPHHFAVRSVVRPFAVIAVAAIALFAACQQTPAPSTSATAISAADEATVRAEFDSTLAWFRTRSFDRWTNLWTEDAVFQPANAKTTLGRAAMLAWANAFPPLENIEFTNVNVHGSGDVAYATSDYTLKIKGMPADTGKQIVVLRRQADGTWRCVAGAFNSDLPMPGSAPVQAGAPKGAKTS